MMQNKTHTENILKTTCWRWCNFSQNVILLYFKISTHPDPYKFDDKSIKLRTLKYISSAVLRKLWSLSAYHMFFVMWYSHKDRNDHHSIMSNKNLTVSLTKLNNRMFNPLDNRLFSDTLWGCVRSARTSEASEL